MHSFLLFRSLILCALRRVSTATSPAPAFEDISRYSPTLIKLKQSSLNVKLSTRT